MTTGGAPIAVTTAAPIEAILRRDRIVVIAGLGLVIAVAWWAYSMLKEFF